MNSSQISVLSLRIAANTAKIDQHLASLSLPNPSFDVDSPPDLFIGIGSDIESARRAVLQDTLELRQLLMSPRELLFSSQPNDLISQLLTARFGLTKFVPIHGETTFADLAARAGIGETHVRKTLRHAMTQHLFCEPRPGFVAHTAPSSLLVDDPNIAAWLHWGADECWRAAVYACDAMEKWPGSEEPNETGFSLGHGTDLSLFDFLAKNPDRATRFAAGMRLYAKRPDLHVRFLVDGGPWAKLPEHATIVDIGGSHGEAAIAIARVFPSVRLIVQDIDPEVVARDPPEDVADPCALCNA
ncbi:hypothetical protein F5Y16DRAFT_374397 [Xylariaceae sp. FL0255]|nr:hypothetical protein F5Y16DRAFT_374397 [Xylariaceae sp. FL0255]